MSENLDPRIEDLYEILRKVLAILDSLAIDCAQHLREQHGQKENQFPLQYFLNISRQLTDIIKKIPLEDSK